MIIPLQFEKKKRFGGGALIGSLVTKRFFYRVSTLFTLYCMCLPSLFIPKVNFTVKFIYHLSTSTNV